MTPFEIPLQPIAQRLTTFLRATQYGLTFSWCDPAECWMMDVADANGVDLLTGLPIVTGADILEQFPYLDIGEGALVAQTDHDADAVPTYANLGVQSHVYYLTA